MDSIERLPRRGSADHKTFYCLLDDRVMAVPATSELMYSPFSKAIFDDPYPVYRRLRDEAPVYRDPRTAGGCCPASTTSPAHFGDGQTFSSKLGPAPENPDNDGRKYSVISMDPPRHDRIRGVLKGFFTPKAVGAMENALQSVVNHHLDRLTPGTLSTRWRRSPSRYPPMSSAISWVCRTPIVSSCVSGGKPFSPATKARSPCRRPRSMQTGRSVRTSETSSRLAHRTRRRPHQHCAAVDV